MKRSEKTEVISSLNKTFSESGGIILLTFQRVGVNDITELRQKIRESGSGYEVVKNTLAKRAAEGTAVSELHEHFSGPTAVAFTEEDPVSLAKVLKDFVKDHDGMSFKAGVLDGQVIDVEQVEDLAEMPSREELLSKLLFLLNAPLTRLATALQSPVRNLAVVMKQLAEKERS